MSSSSASATVRVEKATSDLLMGPDWTLNMDICDSVNSDNWVAKDVVKSVKKRLQHKNPKVQFLALMLLETMIKNCGEYVHFQVVEREILQEMVKIVKKKTDMQVRDKILVLLDSWQEAFGGAGGKYPQYYLAYADLRRSGVQFPERSPDSTLIFTPPVHATPGVGPQIGYGMPSNTALRLDEAMASEMANLSLSDLDSMQSVMELLSEMLKAVNPNDRAAVKDEVIVDLVNQCCSNQKKLLQSINSIRDEELLGRGLELNDNLQSLLAKHSAIASGSPLPDEASESIPSTSCVPQHTATEATEATEASESTSPKTPSAPPPAAPSRYDDEEEDEDDDFAQLARRNSKINAAVSNAQSAAASNQLSLSSQSDIAASSAALSLDGALSSASSNTLTLPNPPTPVKTSSREQDIIDFLSITLSSTPSPPHSPLTPPVAPDQNASPRPAPPQEAPLSYPANQACIPQNAIVAPWAQPQPQSQIHSPSPTQPQQPPPAVFSNTAAYPPPPWAIDPVDTNSTASHPNPFLSTTYQYPAPGAAFYSTQPSRPPQQNNSLGSGASNAQATLSEAPATTITLGQTGMPAAKPYVYAKRLFDDLDWRNTSTGLKTGSPPTGFSGAPGQGMVNGRK